MDLGRKQTGFTGEIGGSLHICFQIDQTSPVDYTRSVLFFCVFGFASTFTVVIWRRTFRSPRVRECLHLNKTMPLPYCPNATALVIPVYIDTGVALTILGVEKLSQQCAARNDEADVPQTLDVSLLP